MNTDKAERLRCPQCGSSVTADWDRDCGTSYTCNSCDHQFSLQQSNKAERVCVCHEGSVCTEGCERGLHHDGCNAERVERHEFYPGGANGECTYCGSTVEGTGKNCQPRRNAPAEPLTPVDQARKRAFAAIAKGMVHSRAPAAIETPAQPLAPQGEAQRSAWQKWWLAQPHSIAKKEFRDAFEAGWDAATSAPVPLTVEDIESTLAPMLWYAMIHHVEGVRYPQGTHQEVMRRYETLLNRVRQYAKENQT